MTRRLLETKFHIPAKRTGDVLRPRLVNLLENGLSAKHKLTLVSAPAGYGKTTLISAWIHSLKKGAKTAWLSLDDEDNQLNRFLNYWISNFSRVDKLLGNESQHLLEATQSPPPITVVETLINELAGFQHPLIIILDDYHVIDNPQIHEALGHFIEHTPANIHLIISTRQDPPLPLARMRARGQMTEIRAQHLRFTQEEAHQFLIHSMKLDLAEETTTALEERTEGWAAGLQLAGLALQNLTDPQYFIETFRGSHRYVLDYLAEEVLRQQSPEIRNFLIQTSILERFNAEACSALTGRPDSQSLIAQLERSNLFIISLDDERCWYRYHHLFADYLRSLLSKAELSLFYKRTAEWHEANNLISDAVRYAIASGDMEFAADTLDRVLQMNATWSDGNVTQLSSWVDSLPSSVFIDRPGLSLNASRIHYFKEEFEQAEALIAQAEQKLHTLPADNSHLLALASLYRGAIASIRGDAKQAIEQTMYALSHLPKENYLAQARGYFNLGLAHEIANHLPQSIENYVRASKNAQKAGVLFLAINGLCAAAQVQIKLGQLGLADQTCQSALQIADGARIAPLGLALSLLGEIALERNKLTAAEKYLQDGISLSRYGGLTEDLLTGLFSLARLRAYQGEIEDTSSILQEINHLLQLFSAHRMDHLVNARLVRLQLYMREKYPAAYPTSDIYIHGKPDEITRIRLLFAKGETTSLLHPLQAILTKANAERQVRISIESMLLLSVLYHSSGDEKNAVLWLEKSLQLAETEGYLRIFWDEAPALLDLLPRVRHVTPRFVQSLMKVYQSEGKPRSVSSIRQLPSPLSEQEIRVLTLIVAGKSNKEIAEELVISLGTAKWHVHNVLQKLGVNNRPQAIVRARELGM